MTDEHILFDVFYNNKKTILFLVALPVMKTLACTDILNITILIK